MTKNTPDSLKRELERTIQEQAKRPLAQKPTRASVELNIHPDMLPLGTVDTVEFVKEIARNYGCYFDDQEIARLVPPNALREEIDSHDLVRLAWRNDKLVGFLGGILRLESIGRITSIEAIAVGEQQVSAVVGGASDEALYLCKNICIGLWKASGISRRWEDIEPYVGGIRYRSTTSVALPFTLTQLLCPELREYMAQQCEAARGLGALMGLRPYDMEAVQRQRLEYSSVHYVDKIELVLSKFNRVTGDAEDVSIDVQLPSRYEANRSEVLITSELPASEHVELVEQLAKTVSGQ